MPNLRVLLVIPLSGIIDAKYSAKLKYTSFSELVGLVTSPKYIGVLYAKFIDGVPALSTKYPNKNFDNSYNISCEYFHLSSGEISLTSTSYSIFVVEPGNLATSTHLKTCPTTIVSSRHLYNDAI